MAVLASDSVEGSASARILRKSGYGGLLRFRAGERTCYDVSVHRSFKGLAVRRLLEIALRAEPPNYVPADRSTVNLTEPWAVRFWTGELGCSEQELRDAVRFVGTELASVCDHLAKYHAHS